MSSQKLDFIVQQTQDLQEANTGLKAGAALTLSRTESNDLVQVMHDGTALGSVPKEQGHLLPVNLPSCTVHSVRKQDGKVTQIVVRAVLVPPSADTCQHPGPAAATDGQPDELAGTTQLSKSQLELLVADESLRGMLRDSRLQEQIRAVDTAADREKALQRHFQIPEFKTFADKVLGCIVAV
ncbi:TPA: hypothetical protein ACH3X3_011066 [Trebouxia sp. C0006]